jgi:hypothetical protein
VPTATHEEALVQVPNINSPVSPFGFGIGVIDHPGCEALAGHA